MSYVVTVLYKRNVSGQFTTREDCQLQDLIDNEKVYETLMPELKCIIVSITLVSYLYMSTTAYAIERILNTTQARCKYHNVIKHLICGYN